jgi:hypothetical protein
MTEERQPRRYARWPVAIDCEVEGASGRASMRLSELSLGGCFVDTRTLFTEGMATTIVAFFPGGELTLPGRVLYVQPGYGFGVGFDALPDSTRERLEAFLRQAESDRQGS